MSQAQHSLGLNQAGTWGIARRSTLRESVDQIQPALIIPTGKRKGQNPSVASVYRALAEHEKPQALLPVARGWAEQLGHPAPWPDGLEEWLAMCHSLPHARSRLPRRGAIRTDAPHSGYAVSCGEAAVQPR
ncbi:hypothetical protein ACPEIC_12875 [Stenotrophomonas sp. NPDC087984]|uniref:hypothetical protein n=1 Tax=unclassified Streptomyces TaxID=2593676 RepID=UPI0036914CA1